MGKDPAKRLYADIALPVPVDRAFTYIIPEELRGQVRAGMRVLVPFGRRRMTGYVLSVSESGPDNLKLKEISEPVDEEPLITPGLIDLARWISEYYVHPLGIVLRTILPARIKGKGRKGKGGVAVDSFPDEAHRPKLNPEQSAVFSAVKKAIEGGVADRFLLRGITGSGKTEVYLRCIEEALSMGKSALVLVPEIALIPQATSRFQIRFGGEVAVLHSRLTGPQRADIWRRALAGEIRVVIGPRSAVFVPLKKLGIIVVDEEQDSSFKQEEKPCYHAVEAARFRCGREKAVLLLGSATPSLESWEAAESGLLRRFKLDSRPAGGTLPGVEIVDMRGKEGIFSAELLEEIERCVGRGEQGIILINRRGHANYIQCRNCGWIDRCPHCSISMTYHSRGHQQVCHYCGHSGKPPDRCPRCGEYKVIQKGAGTQRVEIELQNLVPSARILRMDLDTTTGKEGHLQLLEKFGRGEADLLLGTQMVAKGHHYPDVTLVGILSADGGLNFPDFRAAEKTFQLLSQASGRTGRGRGGGRVVIQAFSPEHFIYEHIVSHDFERFASAEASLRKQLGYPPFSRLILFTLSSLSAGTAERGLDKIAAAFGLIGELGEFELLGPSPALIEKLRGRYRFHLLVKGEPSNALKKKMVETASEALGGEKGVELQWNVDPVNLF